MKKLLLSGIACFAITFFAACSSDSAVSTSEDNAVETANRSTEWEGQIGADNRGQYIITADEAVLRADLEAILAEQGINTTLGRLTIIEKAVVNAPEEVAYMLIGSDATGRSVGVPLKKQDLSFSLDEPVNTVATSCSGCTSGCNLQYYLVDGKKYPYCNENGCIYDCTKSETGLF